MTDLFKQLVETATLEKDVFKIILKDGTRAELNAKTGETIVDLIPSK